MRHRLLLADSISAVEKVFSTEVNRYCPRQFAGVASIYYLEKIIGGEYEYKYSKN